MTERITKREHRIRMLKQKMLGVAMLLICVAMVIVAWNATTIEQSDVGAVLFIAPMGLWLLLSKRYILDY